MNLEDEVGRILGEPATGSRGQGGLPVHGSVVDYTMYFTKAGKAHLVKQITHLIEQQVLGGRIDELEAALLAEPERTDPDFASNMLAVITHLQDRLSQLKSELGDI